MMEWDLTEKRIYQLLKHPYQSDKLSVEDMSSAHLELVEELFNYLNRVNDNKLRIGQLNTNFVDFGTLRALEESYPVEDSKLKLVFIDKLPSLITMEQELIYRQMEYLKFFINTEPEWKPPFYLNNEVIKPADMMGLICGVFYTSRGIVRIDHKEIFLSGVVRIFEKIFNVNFEDIYRKEIAVVKRKPIKIIEFLDRLKAAITQKSRDEGYCQSQEIPKYYILSISKIAAVHGEVSAIFPQLICIRFPNSASSIS